MTLQMALRWMDPGNETPILEENVLPGHHQRAGRRRRHLHAAAALAFSVVSISAAVGVTSLTAYFFGGWAVWLLSAFGSTAVYLLVVGLEMALAQRAAHRHEQSTDNP